MKIIAYDKENHMAVVKVDDSTGFVVNFKTKIRYAPKNLASIFRDDSYSQDIPDSLPRIQEIMKYDKGG